MALPKRINFVVAYNVGASDFTATASYTVKYIGTSISRAQTAFQAALLMPVEYTYVLWDEYGSLRRRGTPVPALTITLTQTTGGTIARSAATVDPAGSVTITATETTKSLASWLVNGVSVAKGAGLTLTLTNITVNQTVSAVFA